MSYDIKDKDMAEIRKDINAVHMAHAHHALRDLHDIAITLTHEIERLGKIVEDGHMIMHHLATADTPELEKILKIIREEVAKEEKNDGH